jgi:two-component system response regulator MprA
MAARILVADDDPAVRNALDRALRLAGYEVNVAADGREALDLATRTTPDAMVLDVLMPHHDGIEVCRRLRRRGDHTPVLLLTAKDAVADRVTGLDAGADDYLVKPFALDELLARVRALLRRWGTDDDVLRFADITVNPATYQADRAGRPLELTRTEFSLLQLFLEHPRQVLPRSVIIDRVWGYESGTTSNSLEVFIGYLRRKTEAADEPRVVHTVRGVGYTLREP